jgi:hypothetical protein
LHGPVGDTRGGDPNTAPDEIDHRIDAAYRAVTIGKPEQGLLAALFVVAFDKSADNQAPSYQQSDYRDAEWRDWAIEGE